MYSCRQQKSSNWQTFLSVLLSVFPCFLFDSSAFVVHQHIQRYLFQQAMFSRLIFLVGLLSMKALADPRTHCTSPTMAPDEFDIAQAITYLSALEQQSGTIQSIAFSVPDPPLGGTFPVPSYITRRGISTVPDIRSRGTIKFEIINPITVEYTHWLSIVDAVRRVVEECILSTEHTGTTTAGWRTVGLTGSLKVSIVNPHQLGFNDTTSHPAVAGNSSATS